MNVTPETRRAFVKKAAYVAPVVLTLAAAPAFAKAGSEKGDKADKGDHPKKPKKSLSASGNV